MRLFVLACTFLVLGHVSFANDDGVLGLLWTGIAVLAFAIDLLVTCQSSQPAGASDASSHE